MPGLVDTNVFIHAQTHDVLAEECLRFLEAVQRGEVEAQLEPVVLHELSYALPHYRKGMTRQEVSEYLLAVLAWKGITGKKDLLVNAVERWRDSARLAFVDAYLAALAAEAQSPVYTKNVAELEAQGALVPNPLPQGAS
ncbi:MAG: PIN domain-containing protein [Dehalococcoidales bacterium]|nr:PIN domain-containing protein [Dehalococcoidales bacterium]